MKELEKDYNGVKFRHKEHGRVRTLTSQEDGKYYWTDFPNSITYTTGK